MKTIGLIGGMSWESSAVYYRLLNERTRERLGGLHSARLLLYSFDFQEIEDYQRRGNWTAAAARLGMAAAALERAGAECLLLCTNTMHKVATELADSSALPLLHIADAVGTALEAGGYRKPLLLGTRFTLEEDFYLGLLRDRYALPVMVPAPAERDELHRIIFDELCQGQVRESSARELRKMIVSAQLAGADCVILGCTELGLLVQPERNTLPVLDSVAVHVDAALRFAVDDAERGLSFASSASG